MGHGFHSYVHRMVTSPFSQKNRDAGPPSPTRPGHSLTWLPDSRLNRGPWMIFWSFTFLPIQWSTWKRPSDTKEKAGWRSLETSGDHPVRIERPFWPEGRWTPRELHDFNENFCVITGHVSQSLRIMVSVMWWEYHRRKMTEFVENFDQTLILSSCVVFRAKPSVQADHSVETKHTDILSLQKDKQFFICRYKLCSLKFKVTVCCIHRNKSV